MAGETRDGEATEITLKAAQTGHLILSMLYANPIGEIPVRLQQMGIAYWMIASALTSVIAQRLVRKLCSHYRQHQSTLTTLPKAVWLTPLSNWQAPGYKHCYRGFYGRAALSEVLPVILALCQSIASGASVDEVEFGAQ